jgi:parvulin-like peptidyl-prolyl isomerase
VSGCQKNNVRRISAGWIVAGALAALAFGFALSCHAGDAPPRAGSGSAVAAADPKANAVVATVNGEPIRQGQLETAIPKETFAETRQAVMEMKLDRQIKVIALRQFLKAAKVEVSPKESEAEIAQLRKTPPSAGCPCCRYASLDQYLKLNYMTLDELAAECWNKIGVDKYLEAQWQKAYAKPEDVAKLLEKERPALRRKYMKASHIFFNIRQDPNFEKDPEGVERKKLDAAASAWARLEKGEPFAVVAKAVSEDQMSAPDGGYLGYITPVGYGTEFTKAITQLKSGAYSKPVLTPFGVHIIKREDLTDDDVVGVLKDDFKDRKSDEMFDGLDRTTKVERPGAVVSSSVPAKK